MLHNIYLIIYNKEIKLLNKIDIFMILKFCWLSILRTGEKRLDFIYIFTTEKNSRAWLIVATFFQLNNFIRAIFAGFNIWSGTTKRKKLGNLFLSDKIGELEP